MKRVVTPWAWARLIIAGTAPPSELLTCQIHIPLPSKAVPVGVGGGGAEPPSPARRRAQPRRSPREQPRRSSVGNRRFDSAYRPIVLRSSSRFGAYEVS